MFSKFKTPLYGQFKTTVLTVQKLQVSAYRETIIRLKHMAVRKQVQNAVHSAPSYPHFLWDPTILQLFLVYCLLGNKYQCKKFTNIILRSIVKLQFVVKLWDPTKSVGLKIRCVFRFILAF